MIVLAHKKQIIEGLMDSRMGPWENKIKHIPNWELYFPLELIEENDMIISRYWRFDDSKELVCSVILKNKNIVLNIKI